MLILGKLGFFLGWGCSPREMACVWVWARGGRGGMAWGAGKMKCRVNVSSACMLRSKRMVQGIVGKGRGVVW